MEVAELNHIFTVSEVPCTVKETPQQGKHVVATRRIPAGTVLFEEIPIVSWPMHSLIQNGLRLCWFCQRIIPQTHKVSLADGTQDKNNGATFCSSECEARSASVFGVAFRGTNVLQELHAFHEAELRRRGDDGGDIPISVESVARCIATMASRILVSILREFHRSHEPVPLNDASIRSQLFAGATKSFNRLVEPPQDTEFEEIDANEWVETVQRLLRDPLQAAFANCEGVAKEASGDGIPLILDGLLSKETIVTLIGQLCVNAQAVNTATILPNGAPAVVAFAGVVCTLQSCLNHSCAPNAMVSAPDGNHEIQVQTTEEIAEGEEVTISYVRGLGRDTPARGSF